MAAKVLNFSKRAATGTSQPKITPKFKSMAGALLRLGVVSGHLSALGNNRGNQGRNQV
jgi:hypothetical protein